MSFRLRSLLVAIVLGLVAGACGGASGSSAVSSPGDADARLVDEFPTLSGETIDLESLRGEDVVLWFWAPW